MFAGKIKFIFFSYLPFAVALVTFNNTTKTNPFLTSIRSECVSLNLRTVCKQTVRYY